MQKSAGQLDLEMTKSRQRKWDNYVSRKLAEAEGLLGEQEVKKLTLDAEREVNGENDSDGPGRRILVDLALKRLKLDRVNAMGQEEFFGYETDEELQEALAQRHG
jgi:hypothetical protein